MREIKFRAWDKVEGGMYHVIGIDWGSNTASLYDEKGNLDVYLDLPKIEIMGYTGLKDRNGKEIFEGDIVSFSTIKTIPKWIFLPETVTFQEGWFLAGKYFLGAVHKNIEVIGNIHENPELIKEE